ncbi:MAG: hypothetical protein TREMPRED_003787 [Tremellales sp. Tagirdzhanova-0007]|nr:MAG: hypothetical protein TREMPRED_003787 [Tremellales sp. Tagirdzhanova-0007]
MSMFGNYWSPFSVYGGHGMSPYYAGGLGIPYPMSMTGLGYGMGGLGMGMGMGMGLGMGMGMGMGYPYGMQGGNPYAYTGMYGPGF